MICRIVDGIPGFNKYCHKWRALLSPPLHFGQLSLFPQNPTYNIPNVGLFRVSVMPSIKCSFLLFLDSRPKQKLQVFARPTGESVAPACGESGQPRARRGRTPQRKVLTLISVNNVAALWLCKPRTRFCRACHTLHIIHRANSVRPRSVVRQSFTVRLLWRGKAGAER